VPVLRHSTRARARAEAKAAAARRTLALGALWYAGTNAITNSMDYAKFYSRSHDVVIHVFDATVALVETHQPRRHLVGEHVDRAQYRAPFAPRHHRDFHLRI
jgi:hypothetical protein